MNSDIHYIPQLLELCESAIKNGPHWGTATNDLNLTLLSWTEGQGVVEHVNDELDVLWIALEGTADVAINGYVRSLSQGGLIVIPRGTMRSLKSTSAKFKYLSIHKRRAGLQISLSSN